MGSRVETVTHRGYHISVTFFSQLIAVSDDKVHLIQRSGAVRVSGGGLYDRGKTRGHPVWAGRHGLALQRSGRHGARCSQRRGDALPGVFGHRRNMFGRIPEYLAGRDRAERILIDTPTPRIDQGTWLACVTGPWRGAFQVRCTAAASAASRNSHRTSCSGSERDRAISAQPNPHIASVTTSRCQCVSAAAGGASAVYHVHAVDRVIPTHPFTVKAF